MGKIKANNKVYISRRVSTATGFDFYDVEETINVFLDIVKDKLMKGESVAVRGLGKFSFKKRSGMSLPKRCTLQ